MEHQGRNAHGLLKTASVLNRSSGKPAEQSREIDYESKEAVEMFSAEIVLIALVPLVLAVCWRNSERLHEHASKTAAALLSLTEDLDDFKRDLKKSITALESTVKEAAMSEAEKHEREERKVFDQAEGTYAGVSSPNAARCGSDPH